MIGADDQDRAGAPRWRKWLKTPAQRRARREQVYSAVAANLVVERFNHPEIPATLRQLANQMAPLVVEMLWCRDRIEELEEQLEASRALCEPQK